MTASNPHSIKPPEGQNLSAQPSAATLALVKHNEEGSRRRARIRKLRRLYAECDERIGEISGLTGFAEVEGSRTEICESDREAMVTQLDAQMAAYREEWERLELEDQAATAEFGATMAGAIGPGYIRTGKIPMDGQLEGQDAL